MPCNMAVYGMKNRNHPGINITTVNGIRGGMMTV